MKTVSSLRLLIDIFYYSLIFFSSAFFIWFFYLWAFVPDHMLLYSKVDLRDMTILGFALVVLSIMTIVLFIITLYHLRKAILKISNNDIYHIDTSKHLKLSGLSIILYALIKSLVGMIKFYIEGTGTIMSLDFKGFGSFWFILILGLFFQLIGRELENVGKLKIENDLTI